MFVFLVELDCVCATRKRRLRSHAGSRDVRLGCVCRLLFVSFAVKGQWGRGSGALCLHADPERIPDRGRHGILWGYTARVIYFLRLTLSQIVFCWLATCCSRAAGGRACEPGGRRGSLLTTVRVFTLLLTLVYFMHNGCVGCVFDR